MVASLPLLLLAANFTSFAGFAANDLTGVANALAFVGFGLADTANLCRDFANQLLVDATDAHSGGFGGRIDTFDVERDTGGGLHLDGMRVTYLNDKILAHLRGTIADAVNFQFLFIAIRHADNHVVDQRAIETVHGLVWLAV